MKHLAKFRRRAILALMPGLGGLLFAPGSRILHAHKFHFTSTLLDYNPASKVYEITVRLFADDIEAVMSRMAGRRIEVDRSPDAERLCFEYLRERLRLRGPDTKPIPLRWVGLEVKVTTVYAYLESDAPDTGLRDLAIQNTIFFDHLPGQVNTVILKDPVHGRPRDLSFRAGDRFKVVIFPDAESPEPASPPKP